MTRDRVTTNSNAHFAESDDCNYTSGAVHLVYDAPVLWESKTQDIVALSKCEPEYIAVSRTLKHAFWLRRLLDTMHGPRLHARTRFSTDNESAMNIAIH